MMPVTGFTSVRQGIAGDVGDVVIRQAVDGLLAAARTGHKSAAPEHSQVLRR
jgi:hypothetical protein